jgi:hypothetical protein
LYGDIPVISFNQRCVAMLIKEYGRVWPPTILLHNIESPSKTDSPSSAEGEDLVVRVQNRYPKGQLWITLRKKDETEYDVGLSVPAFLQERILLSIVLKRNITLREVGEIAIE